MRLIRLHVENFGTLQNYQMELSSGLNVLHHENGWGKSTLAVFIKAMLYGLPASGKHNLDENERNKYKPWQGGIYGGSLEFETEHGRFRIERSFGEKASGDSVTLYDCATRLPSARYSDPFGEALFGIDADGFERTVYLSQRPLKAGDNVSITAKLGGLLDAVDDIGSYDDARDALDKRRQYYVKTGNRGRIADLEERLNTETLRAEELGRTMQAQIQKESEYDSQMGDLTRKRTELKTLRGKLEHASLHRERNAHLEQKSRMLEDLSRFDSIRKQAEQRLGGVHPTDAELADARAHLENIRNAKARLDAISPNPIPMEPLRILSEETAQSVPNSDLLQKMKEQNSQLEAACTREDVLIAGMSNSTHKRFTNGVPSEGEINATYQQFRDAQAAEAQAEQCAATPIAAGAPVVAVLFGCLAAVLAVVSFLPMMQAWTWIGWLGAALCAVGAIVCGVVHANKKHRLQDEKAEKIRAYREQARNKRSAVEHFLARYGFDGSDPARQCGELLSDVRSFRRAQSEVAEAKDNRQGLMQEKHQLCRDLTAQLALFGIRRGEQRSYRGELDALEADLAMLKRVRDAEADRSRRRANADAEYRDHLNCIKPFLDRFDPKRAMPSAAECLRQVEQWEKDFRYADEQYARTSDALSRFIREKKLDEEWGGDESGLDYNALVQREQGLNTEIESLQASTASLENEIDNLSKQTDGLAFCRSECQRLKEEYETAKKNADTIQSTMKFLDEAKEALNTRYLKGMEQSFSYFLSVLTSGEAHDAEMNSSFKVSLRTGSMTREAEYFSRGWRDAMQFCTRLSLADALYKEGEKPFLLLDDPFVNLDDRRMEAARRLLDTLATQYQIVYMVCHADRG